MRTLVLALATLFVLPACLESTDTVVLEKDGSGTTTSTYVVNIEKFESLAEQGRVMFFPDADTSQLPNPFAEVWFKEAADAVEGYTIKKFTEAKSEDARTTTVSGEFTSLEAAAKAGAFFSSTVKLRLIDHKLKGAITGEGGGDGGEGDDGAKRPKVKAWKLTLRDAVAGEYNGMRPADVLPMFEAQLDNLKVVRKVTLPTKILEANGEITDDGRCVTWVVDYKRIQEGGELEMRVVFAAEEDLQLEAFTHEPDLRGMAPRFLEPAPPLEKDETDEATDDK